jgi:hypothetical protein
MSGPKEPNPPAKGQFLVYQTEDGQVKIDVRLEGETAWLTQAHMATLFQTTIPNVNMHLRNIFAEGELQPDSVIQEFLITAADGKRYRTNHYNLVAIISVGYRVKSAVATRFRIWATQKLREFIVKGFVLDDERLKNPDQPFDYFEELLRRIQDIRTSERRFYHKITDIYATSIDYDPTQPESIAFFQTVQNKLHWAITGQAKQGRQAVKSRPAIPGATALCLPSPAGRRARQEGGLEQTIAVNLRRTRDLLLPRLLSRQGNL